jgi:WS/DGAT/MGAT family acyltransferase
MRRMNPLDASWLSVESHETPMHVGNLQIFSLPKNAPEDFLGQLVAKMKSSRDFAPPWNLKLPGPLLGKFLLYWKTDNDLDLDYHVRHSALPKPGGERELGMLISRLHSHPLDFNRPLWECHVIEGLEDDRWAMYTKMHHSLIDGVSGMRLLQRVLSADPNDTDMPPPWTVKPPRRSQDIPPSPEGALRSVQQSLKEQFSSVRQMARAIGKLTTRARASGLTPPFGGPKSMLNLRVTGQRRFATQQYDLAKLKALAKAADCTLNDIVLYLCATGLRRFMEEANTLPGMSLTAGIPVNVRPADDQGTGNAISFIIANLATDVADPLRRLEAIKESTQRAKEHLQSLPRSAITQYTIILMAPYMLQLLTGLGGRMRPVFNVTISNVPGPDQKLYYNGARLEAMYPVSLITHGGALNITCLSYAGTLNFGFTGCRDTLPHMQRLAVYTGEALEELEALIATPKKKARSPAMA